jgi:ligand-binding sensor domain-containing protein
LWIATHDGLNRYDEYEFKKILHSPFNKKSLASNMTIDLVEDTEGNLWILTNTHLHRYNEKKDIFERYILPAVSANHNNQRFNSSRTIFYTQSECKK